MNKFLAIAASLGVLLSTQAHAQTAGSTYVGLDYTYLSFSDSTGPDSFHGAEGYVGYKFTPNFALQAGYFRTLEESDSGVDLTASAINLDLVGSFPVLTNTSLLATLGYSYFITDYKALGIDDSEETNVVRTGLGFDYKISSQVSIRPMVRYLWSLDDGSDSIDDGAWQTNIGLTYSF